MQQTYPKSSSKLTTTQITNMVPVSYKPETLLAFCFNKKKLSAFLGLQAPRCTFTSSIAVSELMIELHYNIRSRTNTWKSETKTKTSQLKFFSARMKSFQNFYQLKKKNCSASLLTFLTLEAALQKSETF